jgi:hypothetical protein
MGLLDYLSPGSSNPFFVTHHYPFNSGDKNADYQARLDATNANAKTSLFGLLNGGLYDKGNANLLDLINNPGQTNGALYNRSLRDTNRDTSMRLDANRARFAKSGFGNSGLGAAFQEAIRGAGENRKQALTEDEARRREDLRRQDLQLLYQFILKPNLDRYANDRGIGAAENAAKAQQNSAAISGGASLIGSLAAAFCHTADELYGHASEDSILARYYMVAHADDATRDLYDGPASKRLAAAVKRDPALRATVRPIFDEFVATAKRDFPTRF